ncbi:MAG: hypothetical protein JO227_04945, partial [Acetobacteraceae bacterium]|nr:hypothetical protein [Acetobacteraceae bacterium]
MTEAITTVHPRRHFLRLMTTAATAAIAPVSLSAQQRDTAAQPALPATPADISTFEEVWRTVRDRFYDPHFNGLDWSAVRDRYMPDAARATSEEMLARIINDMLSELR